MTSSNDNQDILQIHQGDEAKIEYAKLSRRDIRALIFHLLYAMDSFDYQSSLEAIVDNFNRGFDLDIPFGSEAVVVAQAVIDSRDHLDTAMTPMLANWRLERIGVCTKLILRLAIWELENEEVPAVVVINEAIELAKCFAEKDAYRFVNGVLDEYAKAKGYDLEAGAGQVEIED